MRVRLYVEVDVPVSEVLEVWEPTDEGSLFKEGLLDSAHWLAAGAEKVE